MPNSSQSWETGRAFEQVPFEDGHLVGGGKMTPGLSVVCVVRHGDTSVQVMLTRAKESSRSDWGKTTAWK